MALIEEAQRLVLLAASDHLSTLPHFSGEYEKTLDLYDRIKRHWHTVSGNYLVKKEKVDNGCTRCGTKVAGDGMVCERCQ